MIHDHDRIPFHLDVATYLGSDPDDVAEAVCQGIADLSSMRDAGPSNVALAQAEGAIVAALAFIESLIGPADLADVLSRAADGYRGKAERDAAVSRAVNGDKAR